MAHMGKDSTGHGLTSSPGGMDRCSVGQNKGNGGKSGTSPYGGSNNVAGPAVSKVKSQSSPSKK